MINKITKNIILGGTTMENKLKLLLVSIIALILVGCNSTKDTMGDNVGVDDNISTKTIEIGCMTITEPIVKFLAEGLKEEGYNIEAVVFDGNHLPAVTLKDGEIDGVILNQKAWLMNFNKENNSNLVMPEPYMYHARIDMFSEKHGSVDAIPDGATIVIPGDPSNLDRALSLLDETGFITLASKDKDLYNLVDIEKNDRNINIIETEVTATVRSIKDVDAVISTAANVREAGYDHNSELYADPQNRNFPLGLIVRDGDQDEEWVKAIHEYQNSDVFKQKFNDLYDGAYVLFE